MSLDKDRRPVEVYLWHRDVITEKKEYRWVTVRRYIKRPTGRLIYVHPTSGREIVADRDDWRKVSRDS